MANVKTKAPPEKEMRASLEEIGLDTSKAMETISKMRENLAVFGHFIVTVFLGIRADGGLQVPSLKNWARTVLVSPSRSNPGLLRAEMHPLLRFGFSILTTHQFSVVCF